MCAYTHVRVEISHQYAGGHARVRVEITVFKKGRHPQGRLGARKVGEAEVSHQSSLICAIDTKIPRR